MSDPQVDPAKNATADILAFAKKRPLWQQDALRRLATKSALTEQDLTDLLTAAKLEAGSIELDPKPALVPLAEAHLTGALGGNAPIKLKSLGGIENANQLKPGETLGFGPDGITLVYGDNGSGKSGYTRIFKSASAARGSEDILPDVFDAAYGSKPKARATFKIAVKQGEGTVDQDVAWEDGQVPADLLRQLRVFDRKMAVLYVKDKTDIEFVPFNLDLLEHLGALCVKLKEQLKQEFDKLDADKRAQLATTPAGAVRVAAEAITFATTQPEIDAICKWDAADTDRLSELLQLLDNAEKALKALRTRKARIETLHARVAALENNLSTATAESLSSAIKTSSELKAAAEAARTATFGSDAKLLPGVGGAAWKALWDAARRYSAQAAYPAKEFPVTGAAAGKDPQCVLCHQDLDADAKARLTAFENFVKGDVEKQANDATKISDAAISTLNAVAAASSSEDKLTIADIEATDPALATKIIAFFTEALKRKETIVAAVGSGDFSGLVAQSESCLSELKAVSDGLVAKIVEAEAAMTPTRRLELERERDTLRNRKSMGEHKPALEALAANRWAHKKLEASNGQFETTSISREMSLLNKTYITTQFETCLKEELEALGVRRRVTLQVGTQKASSFIKPKFDGSAFTELDRVLSEGEHRAVALACFLAETRMMGTKHTVVIDDPVSSLDHERRHLVAMRLAQEATERQVVVFTHDMVFWCEITDAPLDTKPEITLKDLMRVSNSHCGVVGQGNEPWHNLDVNLRVNYFNQILPSLQALYDASDPGYADQARSAAVKLRDTWERMVEESLFNKALLRFRKSVETKRLAEVVVESADYTSIENGMTRTSNWSHDRSRAQGNAAPTPKELKDEIVAIQALQTTLKERRKKLKKEREAAAPKPASYPICRIAPPQTDRARRRATSSRRAASRPPPDTAGSPTASPP